MFDGLLNKIVPGSEMAEEEEEPADGSNGTMRAAMAARRRKIAKAKLVGAEQETASESREELHDSNSQQRSRMEAAEGGVAFEQDSQTSECIMSEQMFKSEQELCDALRHEVAAAAIAKEQAYHIAEVATGQMKQLTDRCLQLQELVSSLQAALEVNQPSREQSASESCQHQSHNFESSNSELQTDGSEVTRLAVPSPRARKVSSSSADAHADPQGEANTFDLSERLLQDECDELRQEISSAALAEKREQDTAEMHQDQVRRLQRSVQRLQEQARRPRHAFHEAALAAQAEAKKHGGVQRMKRLEDLGESSSNFLFI